MQHPNQSPQTSQQGQPPPGNGTADDRPSAVAGGPSSDGPVPGAQHSPPERKRSLAERTALVEQYLASGHSMRDFTLEHGVAYSTFSYWLRQSKRPARKPKRTRRRFTPEERREAVEQWRKSKRTAKDFAKLWNCSASSLQKWATRYDAEGPRSLENRPHPKGRRAHHPTRLPDEVRQAIREIRERNPTFGVNRVAQHLERFGGIKVSSSTVRNVLKEAGIPMQPAPTKRRRPKPMPLRRFERARPGELWQTDITSFLLRRHHVRVYLTVFLDDHSRFIVSWALATHCKNHLVIESLMEGVSRFGKPKEVLTDQGPQYHTWRGKSAFKKVLLREGIQQVVSRTHHPQTLGKCERLWKTVGLEFWDRVAPLDLDEARERFGHWVDHYNFFRAHQGIDGCVPADRFFGAEEAVRAAMAKRVAENALDLALGEAPRRPLYLTGQIGDQQVSVHGERGGVTVKLPDGSVHELKHEELGCPSPSPETTNPSNDRDDRNPRTELDSARTQTETHADVAQANGVSQGPTTGVERAGSLGERTEGPEGRGACDVHDDPVVLDGEDDEAGCGEATGGDSAARVAAEPVGAFGDAGGPLAAAADAGAEERLRGEADGVAGELGEACAAPGGGAIADRGPGAGLEIGPVERAECGVDFEGRNEPCSEEEVGQQEEAGATKKAPESERCSGRGRSGGRRWTRWLRPWVGRGER